MRRLRILALGGGGVTNGTDPALDDLAIATCGVPRPRLGFVGTASGDDPVKIGHLLAGFEQRTASIKVLAAGADGPAAAAWLAGLDLVYVGGGNTLRLLNHWRASGVGAALLDAARGGLAIAGVSAGAVCWFAQALSDATGRLAPLEGLGLLPGSCCPHAGEAGRMPAFRAAIAAGALPEGIAIEDGVAVLCDERGAVGAVSARPGAGAWRVTRDGAGSQVAPLPAL